MMYEGADVCLLQASEKLVEIDQVVCIFVHSSESSHEVVNAPVRGSLHPSGSQHLVAEVAKSAKLRGVKNLQLL